MISLASHFTLSSDLHPEAISNLAVQKKTEVRSGGTACLPTTTGVITLVTSSTVFLEDPTVAQLLLYIMGHTMMALQAEMSWVRFPKVSLRPHYGPGVDSTCNRNEYQEYFLWGGRGGKEWR